MRHAVTAIALTFFRQFRRAGGRRAASDRRRAVHRAGLRACPPAPSAVNALAYRGDILALSFAVTYWDAVGWRDIGRRLVRVTPYVSRSKAHS